MISLGLGEHRRAALGAGRRVRLLIVDDSSSMRNLLTRVLHEESWIEVVGTASDGEDALRRVAELRPDVITLDVEMPHLNGLEALRRIRKSWPSIVVIMLSSLTETGAAATIDALMNGANDYVSKTPPPGCTDAPQARLRRELVTRIRQFFSAPEPVRVAVSPLPPAVISAAPRSKGKRRVVAIGVSTGGPTALNDVIPVLPANLTLPVLVVQHMPAMFTRILAERLDSASRLSVCEGADGMPVEAGHVYIAPGGFHMTVRSRGGRECIALDESAPEHSCRPAVDPMLRSVNAVYGKSAIGVILTGMGQDGLLGCQLLKKTGACIIAQDERSSVVWGMPGAVARAGIADAVLDIKSVVPEILKQL
ncbi:MAG TPA: chemotaxis response regulator protein-glutamate methylesterase [Bryobacteraceae bacterium]|nr:chemotaxis response regulator protein-glutamate methylesterase [Bryobacteraceae bacterium]